ncbi:uncharacterized protein LOC110735924 [Chenopodium quinoa]|uniref:uncharacterized protein LOC110735924 n=1 Tax=Chenopodium quinoa TaxID=63459 RepID=UPI000B78348C|nr:uncharacterized protein LOC110735924 [Chenopodium quinoa]
MRPFCEHCIIPGYSIEKCYKLHGYPPNFAKGRAKKVATIAYADEEEESDDHVTHISQNHKFNCILKALQSQNIDDLVESQAHMEGTCLLTCSNAKWIVDSGAINHICSNLHLFESYKCFDKKPNIITTADGKHVTVEHIGAVHFDNGITLQNVLHVPGLKFNLIYTHRLCKDLECEIVFTYEKCLIQGPTLNRLVVLGNMVSGLYAVDGKEEKQVSQEEKVANSELVSRTGDDAKRWHLRLGHMPFNKLYMVNSGLDNKVGGDIVCQICHKARQTRKPFPESMSRAERNVKCVRTDNAIELCEGDILQVYRVNGILHQKSCVDTPQQNRMVERNYRHLLETARALYFQSRVPVSFWSECLLTATHVINRMPLSSVKFTSPYELLHDKKPVLSHLKVFGCLCYVSTLKTETLVPEVPVPVPAVRQSDRPRKRPNYLDSYVCAAETVNDHWCNIVTFEVHPTSMKALINKTTQVTKPVSYLEDT